MGIPLWYSGKTLQGYKAGLGAGLNLSLSNELRIGLDH